MYSVLPARLSAAIVALRERPISVTDKGFGRIAPAGPASAASLSESRPSLFSPDFLLPLMVLRESALRHNIESMAGYCAAAGVQLAPHGKTTMAPQLVARQLEAGAWGVTAATVAEAQVFRSFGMPRVLIANEVTDRGGIEWLAGELAADPGFDCYCYVDSMRGVALLDEVLRSFPALRDAGQAGRRLPVLVELGQPGGRAGCRSIEEAVQVMRATTATSTLRLAGAAGYEGSIGHDDADTTLAAIARFCQDLRTLGSLLPPAPGGRDGYLLSAGGSAYFDVVVRELTAGRPNGEVPAVLLRSGAYITHDHGFYAGIAPGARSGRPGPSLVPALELWAPVLSRPEPGLAILCAGRRDVSFDQGMPIPLRTRPAGEPITGPPETAGMRVTALDDQHAYLQVRPDSPLAPGDLVCLGISHPCTSFDKWRVIPVVDDEYRVIDAIHTFF